MMHGHEKSDPAIVVMKPANKAEGPFAARPAEEKHAAESVERRAGAKGNTRLSGANLPLGRRERQRDGRQQHRRRVQRMAGTNALKFA